jgi:hypothetical protein
MHPTDITEWQITNETQEDQVTPEQEQEDKKEAKSESNPY